MLTQVQGEDFTAIQISDDHKISQSTSSYYNNILRVIPACSAMLSVMKEDKKKRHEEETPAKTQLTGDLMCATCNMMFTMCSVQC